MKQDKDLTLLEKVELTDYLMGFLTAERREKFLSNIDLRTRHCTVVLEDIYQSHNASAVLRTCDCFGIQDVHIIENQNRYEVNQDVALGASKWLTLHKYDTQEDNTVACLTWLKSKGYCIYATTPHHDDVTPETIPLDNKIALVFGTELQGLTATAMNLADGFVKIPMFGFTESLNISVSAAIFMQNITSRLRKSNFPWKLSEPERSDVLLEWLKNSIKRSELLIEDFMEKKQNH